MKAALQLDPGVDVVANRLPNVFISRRRTGERKRIDAWIAQNRPRDTQAAALSPGATPAQLTSGKARARSGSCARAAVSR
jgi:hypothetical protein